MIFFIDVNLILQWVFILGTYAILLIIGNYGRNDQRKTKKRRCKMRSKRWFVKELLWGVISNRRGRRQRNNECGFAVLHYDLS